MPKLYNVDLLSNLYQELWYGCINKPVQVVRQNFGRGVKPKYYKTSNEIRDYPQYKKKNSSRRGYLTSISTFERRFF